MKDTLDAPKPTCTAASHFPYLCMKRNICKRHGCTDATCHCGYPKERQ